VAPAAAPNPVQALLLVGWLAGRLNWKLEPGAELNQDATRTIRLGHSGGQVMVHFEAAPGEDGAGQVVGLQLACGNQARFGIEAADSGECMQTTVQVGTGTPLTHITRRQLVDDTSILMQELAMIRRDRSFEMALARAVELVKSG
jgi:glucose-6-phosphate dehydrogenase assembly protein OpcA